MIPTSGRIIAPTTGARTICTSRSMTALRRSTAPVVNTPRAVGARSAALVPSHAFDDEFCREIHDGRDEHQQAADHEEHAVVETAFDRFAQLGGDGRGQRAPRIE